MNAPAREFIGAPNVGSGGVVQKELMSTLPKEPSELTHAELLESYYKLALRCFQSENSLDMAKELIKSLERALLEERVKTTFTESTATKES
jgi:hypothetical protein